MDVQVLLQTAIAELLPGLNLAAVAARWDSTAPVDDAGKPVRVEGIELAFDVDPMRWDDGLFLEVSDGSRWVLALTRADDIEQ